MTDTRRSPMLCFCCLFPSLISGDSSRGGGGGVTGDRLAVEEAGERVAGGGGAVLMSWSPHRDSRRSLMLSCFRTVSPSLPLPPLTELVE